MTNSEMEFERNLRKLVDWYYKQVLRERIIEGQKRAKTERGMYRPDLYE
jgi:hypothetical protein